MDWACRDCGRVHDTDPGTCACGSDDLRPRDEGGSALERARQRLLDPDRVDTDLTAAGPFVALAFRLLVGLVVVLAAGLVLTWLL